jgi:hypothetical protein
VIARRLAAERQCPCVVVIADHGRQSVRTKIRIGMRRHAQQVIAIGRRHLDAAAFDGRRCNMEQLRDQSVVRRRPFEIHAVRVGLSLDLARKHAPGFFHPAVWTAVTEKSSTDDERRRIGRQVIAVDVANFDVASHEKQM